MILSFFKLFFVFLMFMNDYLDKLLLNRSVFVHLLGKLDEQSLIPIFFVLLPGKLDKQSLILIFFVLLLLNNEKISTRMFQPRRDFPVF